jgi:hypothetical protein
MNAGTVLAGCVMLLLSVDARAQAPETAPIATTRIAACVTTPACVGFLQTAPASAPPKSNRSWPWVRRHPVLSGALIGAGVGAALGATGGTESGNRRSTQILFTMGVGAGVGALVGFAFR